MSVVFQFPLIFTLTFISRLLGVLGAGFGLGGGLWTQATSWSVSASSVSSRCVDSWRSSGVVVAGRPQGKRYLNILKEAQDVSDDSAWRRHNAARKLTVPGRPEQLAEPPRCKGLFSQKGHLLFSAWLEKGGNTKRRIISNTR